MGYIAQRRPKDVLKTSCHLCRGPQDVLSWSEMKCLRTKIIDVLRTSRGLNQDVFIWTFLFGRLEDVVLMSYK